MATLSKVAVSSVEVLRLVTANPMYTLCAMFTVWLVPTAVQFTPSTEPYIVNAFPLRVSFSQFGTVTPPNDWYELLLPVLVRSVIQLADE